MKYRRLRADELEDLKPSFVQFLAANTVTSEDWEQLKQEQPEKAEQLIELFSDLVIGQTMEKVRYLEYKAPADLKTFHCQEDKMLLNGLRIAGESSLDFTQDILAEDMIRQLRQSGAKLQLYSAEKSYSQNRELELFALIEQGAKISPDGSLYQTLESLKK